MSKHVESNCSLLEKPFLCSIGLRRKQFLLPDKWREKTKCSFCFKISINSFCEWRHFLFKISISVQLKLHKTKSDATVLIKLCPPVTSINLMSFIRVFVLFSCCHGLSSFFRCLFLFVFRCFCYCCLFSLWFSFLAKVLPVPEKMQPLRQPLLNWS